MISKTDMELATLLNLDRGTITSWRINRRNPHFAEVLKYEEILVLPFECFITREPNLEEILLHVEKITAHLKDDAKTSISNNDVAKTFEISHNTVSRWKQGLRSPQFNFVMDFEQKLEIPFELFMSSKPDIEAIESKLKGQIKVLKKLIKQKEQESLL